MIRALLVFASLLVALPTPGRSEAPSGHLVLIGGGDRPADLMVRIAQLAGGSGARILIVPIAHPEPAAAVSDLIEELTAAGAGRVEALDLDREGADGWENHQRIDQATGIFLTGGDQSLLAGTLRGTELLERIRALHQRGGVVVGTSAGATALGSRMIVGPAESNQDPDRAVPRIRAGSLALEPGLDLLSGTIVDQHFLARRRHNRLLTALLESPELLGLGIDEATAVVIGPEGRLEVVGESLVAVYDLGRASGIETDDRGNLAASGITLHLLRAGQRLDLGSRRVVE